MLRLAMMLLLLLIGPIAAYGESVDFDPVEAGAQGLSHAASFPWYDRKKGELAPVDVKPARDSLENRSSTWLKGPAPTRNRRPWNLRWGSAIAQIFEGLGWFLLAAVLAVVVVILGWALMQRDRARKRGSAEVAAASGGKEAQTAQIENLPFPLEPTELDLLAEARKHFKAGDYEKAIVYLFSYQLVQLDHRQFLRLARGKTNRQYLRELRAHPVLRSLLEQTMVRFEDVFFGGRNLNQTQFATCWDRLNEFHQHMEQPAT